MNSNVYLVHGVKLKQLYSWDFIEANLYILRKHSPQSPALLAALTEKVKEPNIVNK